MFPDRVERLARWARERQLSSLAVAGASCTGAGGGAAARAAFGAGGLLGATAVVV
jgi:hypothetical protein